MRRASSPGRPHDAGVLRSRDGDTARDAASLRNDKTHSVAPDVNPARAAGVVAVSRRDSNIKETEMSKLLTTIVAVAFAATTGAAFAAEKATPATPATPAKGDAAKATPATPATPPAEAKAQKKAEPKGKAAKQSKEKSKK